MAQKSKLIFICSNARSGSTVLQAMLSTSQRLVGVGEIIQNHRHLAGTRRYPINDVCTCGAAIDRCDFWGNGFLHSLAGKSLTATYLAVIEHFASHYPARHLVDNSKYIVQFAPCVPAVSNVAEVKVLFLVRDFRGWIPSIQRRRQSPKRFSQLRNHFVRLGYIWKRRNQQAEQLIAEQKLDYLLVLYDRLLLEPEQQLRRIERFLQLDANTISKDLSASFYHELTGSDTLGDRTRDNPVVRYDFRWMEDATTCRWGPFLAPVYRYNQRLWLRSK